MRAHDSDQNSVGASRSRAHPELLRISSLPFANRILRPQSNAPRTVVARLCQRHSTTAAAPRASSCAPSRLQFYASRAVADLLSQRRLECVGGVLLPLSDWQRGAESRQQPEAVRQPGADGDQLLARARS